MKPSVIIATVLTLSLLGTANVEAQRRDTSTGTSKEKTTTRRTANQENAASVKNPSRNQPRAGQNKPGGRETNQQPIIIKKNKEPRQYPPDNAYIVHDRRGGIGPEMPGDRIDIDFGGQRYHYSQGRYYKRFNDDFRMVPPPHGIRVTIIPRGYLTLMVAGIPYFYYEGVYYRHYETDRYYEVVAPPMGAIVPELPGYGVRTLYIDDKTVLEYDNILYKPIVTRYGVQYKVIGMLSAELYDDNY